MTTEERRNRSTRQRRLLSLALPGLAGVLLMLACSGTSTILTPTATPTAAAGATSTATAVATVAPTGTTWDTAVYSAPIPGPCDPGMGHWFYFNNGTNGSYTCLKDGIKLTELSTVNFSGVMGALPPALRIKAEVASMSGSAPQASLILYLNGGPSNSSQVYYFDFAASGEWHVRRYNPQTVLASGTLAPSTNATLIAESSGQVRTFTINGTVVAAVNDGLTFTAASSSAFSLGGEPGDSAIFRNFVFTPL